MRKNKNYYIVALVLIIIIIFQINKKNKAIANDKVKVDNISDYDELIDLVPIYKDETYYVYIAKILNIPKILYLRRNNISQIQKESKFFVHLYPKDTTLLKDNQNFLAFDFKNNGKSFK